MTQAVSADGARQRARVGVVALAVRSTAHIVLSFAAMLVLARLLKPADFGVFAIVQFAMALLGLFGNVGFGPALIQQKEMPTQRALATIWWAQLGLAALIVPALLAASTVVRDVWRDLPDVAEPLVRVLAIAFLCNTLRVVPTIQLERELRFVTVAVIELLGSVTYFGTAVGLAYLTGDVSALVYAVVAQAVVSCALTYASRPWRPTIEFDPALLRSILRYGIAYQGNTLVGFANNAIAPLLVGIVLGKVALGLNGFAQTLAWLPLRLVEIFGRVGFPLYSSLQDDPARLARELRFNVRICGVVTALCSSALLVVGGPALELVYGAKWQAAVPLMHVYALVVLIGFFAPIAGAMLYGLGRPGLMLRLALGWTALNWAIVSVALALRPQIEVYALAYSVHVVVGNLVALVLLRRVLPQADIGRILVVPALAAALIGAGGGWALAPVLRDVGSIALAGLGSCVAVVAVVALLDRGFVPALRNALDRRLARRSA